MGRLVIAQALENEQMLAYIYKSANFQPLNLTLKFGAAVAGGLAAEKGKRKQVPTAADESVVQMGVWLLLRLALSK
nr:hypothetical protein [Tanacetum cinerariifolium]